MIIPALLAAMLTGYAPAQLACSGADPAITKASVQSVSSNGDLTYRTVAVTVTNLGSAGQHGDLLQSVDVYQDNNKVDQKGVPPLRPGQSATVLYQFKRSSEARRNSTRLDFRMDVQSAVPGPADCNPANDHLRLNA